MSRASADAKPLKTAYIVATARGLVESTRRLQQEAEVLLQFTLDSSLPVEEQIETCGLQQRKAQAHSQLLERKLPVLQRTLAEWQHALASLTAKDSTEEEVAAYSNMAASEDGILLTVEAIDQLIAKLGFFESDMQQLKASLSVSTSASPASAARMAASPQAAIAAEAPNFTAPFGGNANVKLPKFGGGSSEWTEFWPLFHALVDSTQMPTIAKVSSLANCLVGSARKVIQGYALIASNYETIKEVLHEEYGNPEEIRKKLRNELKSLHTTNRWEDLKEFATSVDRILRQLENAGESIETDLVYEVVISKLPYETRLLIAQEKRRYALWNSKAIRESLKSIVAMKKMAYEEGGDSVSRPQGSAFGGHRSNTNSHAGNRNGSSVPTHRVQSSSFLAAPRNMHMNTNRAFSPQRGRSTPSHIPRQNVQTSRSSDRPPWMQRPPSRPCVFCSGMHWQAYCEVYTTAEQRRTRATALHLCFKCLKTGHSAPQCSAGPCSRCRNAHNAALCTNSATNSARQGSNFHRRTVAAIAAEVEHEPERSVEEESRIVAAGITRMSRNENTLETAISVSPCQRVAIFNPRDPRQKLMVTTFFDSGAHGSYITDRTNSQLQLPLLGKAKIFFKGIAGFRGTRHNSDKVQLGITLRDGSSHTIEAYTLPQVTENLLHAEISHEELGRLWDNDTEELPIALYNSEPELIIGTNFHYETNPTAVKRLKCGFHILDSAAGPMLGGQGQVPTQYRTQTDTQVYSMMICPANIDIEEFWSLEALGIDSKKEEVEDDELAVQQFQRTIRRNPDGRYSVSWPWKTDSPDLANNYGLCLGRLKSVLTKLQGNPKMLRTYTDTIAQQLKAGIIEEAPRFERGRLMTHLPHQAVINEQKASTKLRVVFDASASAPKGKALNNFLFRGPILLPDLVGLLLRFRQTAVALVSDIEKAFLQLALNEGDREVTRFLWVRDPSKPIDNENPPICFRFARVPFGVISSPFLLQSVIRYHLEQCRVPLAKEIKRNTYVDNIIIPANSEEEGITAYRQSKEIFTEARMNLRDFLSNSSAVMTTIDVADRHEGPTIKVLGLIWNAETDTLQVPTHTMLDSVLTRRTLLRFIASHFDPLGYIAPVLLPLKRCLQELTKQHLDWDDELSTDMVEKVRQILNSWKPTTFEVPRFLGKGTCSLHVFTDASETTYAAAVFIRHDNNGVIRTSLVFAKSRLRPIKGLTIQRLELLGIFIGVRAINFVAAQMNLQSAPKFLWSDSRCALAWVCNGQERKLTRFVKNRVKEIKRTTDIQYGYVKSADNAADVATRGAPAAELHTLRIWWRGPEWLSRASEEWPQGIPKAVTDEAESEVDNESAVFTHLNAAAHQPTDLRQPIAVDATRFSDWNRLKTTAAWMFRFLKKISSKCPAWLRNFSSRGPLAANDYKIAETILIRQAQNDVTQEDIGKWNLVKDEESIWRCHGRLSEAALPIARKYPIFLPRKNSVTRLLILHVHRALLHSGVSMTLAQVRRRFWIPQGRQEIKTVVSTKCMGCKRWTAKPFALPPMPSLPSDRVQVSRPFQHVGTDYLGPILVKTTSGLTKRWIALYTCLCTRALHLELSDDLSAESCLHCFRRFVARRGQPDTVLSDNATNYALASKTIALMKKQTASTGTEWHYITEKAPWKGGAYERLVGLTKNALKRAIGKRLLQENDLRTLLHEVEAVLNQRPITTLSSDTIEALRPADFLVPHVDLVLDPGTENEDDDYNPEKLSTRENLLLQWQESHSYLSRFWQLWTTSYFHWLRERTQRKHKGQKGQTRRTPRIGELVILHEDSHSRAMWKLARIESIPVGTENAVRTATIRTANKHLLTRPISLLYPLEVDIDSDPMDCVKVPDVHNFEDEQADTEPTNQAISAPTNTRITRSMSKRLQDRAQNVHCVTISKIFFLLIVTALIPKAEFQAFRMPHMQLCPFRHAGIFVQFPPKENCNRSMNENFVVRNVSVYHPTLVRINATYCSKIIREVCTKAFLRLSLQVVKDSSTALSISAAECASMGRTKAVNNVPLQSLGSHKWRTSNPTSYSYPLFGTRCTKTANFLLEFGEIAFLDGTNVLTDFTRTSGCKPASNHCFTAHETIIWNFTDFSSRCRYEFQGTYMAHVTSRYVLVDELQAAFVRQTHSPPVSPTAHCDISEPLFMENGVVISIHKGHFLAVQASKLDQKRVLMTEQIGAQRDPENTRLQFLYEVMLRRAANQWCMERNNYLDVLRWMSITDTTAAVRMLLGRTDIAGHYVGESILVTACQQVVPTKIYGDHRAHDRCYEWLPVELGTRLAFVLPHTHDIVLHSKEVTCDWKPPQASVKVQLEGFASAKRVEQHIIFNSKKMPDLSQSLIELALDRLGRRGFGDGSEETKPATFNEWLTDSEEFLNEVGHEIDIGAQAIQDYLDTIFHWWKLATGGIGVILLGIAAVFLYLKCFRTHDKDVTVKIEMGELPDSVMKMEDKMCEKTEQAGYTPHRLPQKRRYGRTSTPVQSLSM